MQADLVSVIIPVYNQEKYLDRCLPTVLSQSYHALDIIAIDDGSTDASFDILYRYASKDERLRIIRKENGGLVDAVSTGIRAAIGKYICFLDPDDEIGSDFVFNFISKMDQAYDVVACGFYREKGEVTETETLRENAVISGKDLTTLKEDFLWDKKKGGLSNRIGNARWNKIYRTEILLQVVDDYQSCQAVSFGEDAILNYLVLCHAEKYKVVAAPNEYHYCMNSDNSMIKKTDPFQQYEKCKTTFLCFQRVLKKYGDSVDNAYYLYFDEVNAAYRKAAVDKKTFWQFLRQLRRDAVYRRAIQRICRVAKHLPSLEIRTRLKLSAICYWIYRKKYDYDNKI